MGGILQDLVEVTPEVVVVVVAVQVLLHGVLGQILNGPIVLGEELYRLSTKRGRVNTPIILVVLLWLALSMMNWVMHSGASMWSGMT